jgi:hypothetical protein
MVMVMVIVLVLVQGAECRKEDELLGGDEGDEGAEKKK